MKWELAEHLDKIRDTVTEVGRIVFSHRYPDDRRTVFVMGLLATMTQHHQSALQLLKSGAVGSSYALTRDLVRAMRYGLWINACATEEQILRLEKGEEFPLSIPEMTKEVEAAYCADPFFGDVNSPKTPCPVSSSLAVGILTQALDCTATMKRFETPRQLPLFVLCF